MRSWVYLLSVMIVLMINKLIKITLLAIHEEPINLKTLTRSGDMPSDHSAMVASITTTLGLVNGFDHPLFALSLVFAILVVYDSMHVRLSAGEQGEALNQLLIKRRKKPIEVHLGHEPIEVYVGILIGGVVSFLIYQLF